VNCVRHKDWLSQRSPLNIPQRGAKFRGVCRAERDVSRIFSAREARARARAVEDTRDEFHAGSFYYEEETESEPRWRNKGADASWKRIVKVPIVIPRGKFQSHAN